LGGGVTVTVRPGIAFNSTADDGAAVDLALNPGASSKQNGGSSCPSGKIVDVEVMPCAGEAEEPRCSPPPLEG
jgi:hypothetical protein